MTVRDDFFKEYEALVRKYGAWIDSCGCCPPWVESLRDLPDEKHLEDHILTLANGLKVA